MKIPTWLFWLILALIPLAFFINLGIYPFIDDEGNRSLVALEMLWSGHYITPTLHGAYYYNKPPLWNWILATSFYLFGEANEWTARLPAVLSLLGFTATIFYYYRKHFSRERALLIAFIFITSGRIVFWESLLALIDISFSWAIFTLFMVIFHEGKRGRWWQLFLYSYLLMVIGFMFKGLPAIVFQAFTLIAYLAWKKSLVRLFSLAHIASGLLSLALLALYYGAYQQYHSLEEVFNTLFAESGKRTAVSYGLLETLKHMLSFPLKVFYHFLPWSFLVILLLRRQYRRALREKPIVTFGLIVFGVNIIVYWLSPNFYPRYILMLIPLGIAALLQLYPETVPQKDWIIKTLRIWGGLVLVLIIMVNVVVLFLEDTQFIDKLVLKAAVLAVVSSVALFMYYKTPASAWFILVAGILIFRIGFDLFALPPRANKSSGQKIKNSLISFAHRWEGRQVAVFHETDMEPAASFYMENTLGYIVPRHQENMQKGLFYIYNPDQYEAHIFGTAVDSFSVRHTVSPYYYVAPLLLTDTAAIKAATIRIPKGF